MSLVFRVPGHTPEDLQQERALANLTAPPGREGLAEQRNLIDLLRRANRERLGALNTAAGLEDFMHPACTDDARIEARELMRSVLRLPRQHARLLILRAAGFGYPEIAAREGLRPKQVDNRLREARGLLREAL